MNVFNVHIRKLLLPYFVLVSNKVSCCYAKQVSKIIVCITTYMLYLHANTIGVLYLPIGQYVLNHIL